MSLRLIFSRSSARRVTSNACFAHIQDSGSIVIRNPEKVGQNAPLLQMGQGLLVGEVQPLLEMFHLDEIGVAAPVLPGPLEVER